MSIVSGVIYFMGSLFICMGSNGSMDQAFLCKNKALCFSLQKQFIYDRLRKACKRLLLGNKIILSESGKYNSSVNMIRLSTGDYLQREKKYGAVFYTYNFPSADSWRVLSAGNNEKHRSARLLH